MKKTRYLKKNYDRLAIILFAVLIIGTVFGAIFFRKLPDISELKLTKHTVFGSFSDNFPSIALIMLTLFISGFSAIAQPLEISALFAYGVSLSVKISGVYTLYGWRGFLFTLFSIIPFAMANSFFLMLASREALKLSGSLTGFVFSGDGNEKTEPKLYMLKFCILSGLIIVCEVLASLVSYLCQGILKI